ncbi:MAG TPA: sialidase family protein [Gemmatimonadaceae bacterium]|nr:sialidase family protein [Gemmatimonadaceae bacterium]
MTTVGVRTREPMLVQHPGGTLFVAGYAVSTQGVWRSTNEGAVWSAVDFGPAANGLRGNSDTDLAVAPDGTLYFASMTFDRTTFEGRQIAVAVSRDTGATWRWSRVSANRFDDRPWIKVAPDGTVHVIWNDGSGVHHRISRDRGETWITMPRISERGGSSHLAIGSRGEIAVRVAPVSASGGRYDPGTDEIRISTDGGKSWVVRVPPGHPAWSAKGLDRWVEPLAWDTRGYLYAAWTEGRDVRLARSTDAGVTWTTWTLTQGDDTALYPWLTIGPRDRMAITWHSGSGETLRWQVAMLPVPHDGEPRDVRVSAPQLLDAWTWSPDKPDLAPVRSTAGEYLAALFLRDGGLAVVTPVQSREREGFTWWRFVQ